VFAIAPDAICRLVGGLARSALMASRGWDARAWDERYRSSELLWSAEPNRFLVQETAMLLPGRALDLACGEGRNAVWLAERGWRVTGVDFSGVALAKARQLAASRGVEVEWVLADLLAYEPEPRAFDLVALFYLQLPAAQRTSVVSRAAEAVAPGGTLLIVAHDSANLEHGYGGPRDAAVLYTARDLAEDLRDSGLRIERAERVERPVQEPGGSHVALDALLRASRPGE
jgi:SAM-dependent methyltransferase